MKKTLYLFALVGIFFAGCNPNTPATAIQISPEALSAFDSDGGPQLFHLFSQYSWNASGSEPWCVVTPAKGSAGPFIVKVTAGENTSIEARSAVITITNVGGETKTITVTQKPAAYVAVTNIADVPAAATAGTSLELTGTAEPINATNKAIVWSVKNAGGTEANIAGNTFIVTTEGTATITATITNGKAAGEDYTQDFDIIVTAAETPVITIVENPMETINETEGNILNSLYATGSVSNGATPAYQWYGNTTDSNTGGTPISEATDREFAIPKTLTAGTYYYFCEVRADGAASMRTTVATVNVTAEAPLTFTHNVLFDIPASTVGRAISNINVATGASGGKTPYTFTATGLPAGITISTAGLISGTPTTAGSASTATVTVKDGTMPTAYIKSITIACGAVASGPPVITMPPANANVTAGGTAEFTIAATGEGIYLYRWYASADGTVFIVLNDSGYVSGAGSTKLTLTGVTEDMSGYQYRCYVYYNDGGAMVLSKPATLTVTAEGAPVITIATQPQDVTVEENRIPAGTAVSVAAGVTQDKTLSYRWYINSANSYVGATAVPGAEGEGASFAISTASRTGITYMFCELSAEDATTVRSAIAKITITKPR